MSIDKQIGRRAVICGAIALAVGVNPDIAKAAVAATGVTQRKDGKLSILMCSVVRCQNAR